MSFCSNDLNNLIITTSLDAWQSPIILQISGIILQLSLRDMRLSVRDNFCYFLLKIILHRHLYVQIRQNFFCILCYNNCRTHYLFNFIIFYFKFIPILLLYLLDLHTFKISHVPIFIFYLCSTLLNKEHINLL